MLLRTWAMMRKELIQMVRDRVALALLLGMPLVLLVTFAFAIHMTVDHIPTVVSDGSLDAASRRLVEAMTTSGFFDVVAYAPDQEAVIEAIDRGDARVGLVIPPGFAERQRRGEAQALVLVDGSDMLTAKSAYDAAQAVASAHAAEVAVEQLGGQAMAHRLNLAPLRARVRILYNPNLTDLLFVVPGIVAMITQTQTMFMTAAAVVREREDNTIEALLVTPVRPLELMVGKMAPGIVVGLVNILSVLGAAVYGFGVPFQGDFWLFLALSLLFIAASLSLSLLISSISQNQNQTIQLVTLFAILGAVITGFMFPREGMPQALQMISNLFPLAHFIPITRGIMLKGVGLEMLRPHVIALGMYAVGAIGVAALFYRQRLD